LFRVFGIRLAVHFTFPLLLAYAVWDGWRQDGWLGGIWSVAAILLLFTCVVLHELGHSLTARRFGITVSRILLLPIGGMAEFDSIPRRPRSELLITLAGPAVNFAIVLLLLPWLPVSTMISTKEVPVNLTGLALEVWLLNLVMGCFNLLPVFPMDGGRIFRALLAMRLPYLTATRRAAGLGKVLAVAGAVVAAFWMHNYLAVLLFGFIFVAGDLEYRAVRRREEERTRWRQFLGQAYGLPDAPGGDTTAGLLHGPN
jgi:Zn-dependent protease